MTDLVDAILENDLVTANALFEQEMKEIVAKKLVEMKKEVAAELFESTTQKRGLNDR